MVRLTTLERYVIRSFLGVLYLSLLASISLFFVIEAFDKIGVLIQEDATFIQAWSYLLLKVPLIVHLMLPVSMLVATLVSLGQLSRSSEVTAMRASGMSIIQIASPLIWLSLLATLMMFFWGETVVPSATRKSEEIYNYDIKKKHLSSSFDRSDLWYRDGNRFISAGVLDARQNRLKSVSIYETDKEFRLIRRTDAQNALWSDNPLLGWTMSEVVQTTLAPNAQPVVRKFPKLPLLLEQSPDSLKKIIDRKETMGYFELKAHMEKVRAEGAPINTLLVDLAAKISFPFVALIVVILALPLSIVSTRSKTISMNILMGITIGFTYYITHAISTSLGYAELLPVIPSAWAANILLGSLGCWMLGRIE